MSGGAAPSRFVLLVEDDPTHAELARRALERCENLAVEVVETLADARARIARRPVDLVLADLRLPDGSGLDLLTGDAPVVVQTSQGDESRAVAAMKGGALDYCVKSPETYRDLPIVVERALNASRNLFERRRIERSLHESDERFRQLAASIPEVFWLFDVATGEVVYASPAWTSVYGDVPVSWEGRLERAHPDDVGPPAVRGAADRDVFRVACGRTVRWVEERRLWILDAAGRPYRLSCLAADVTHRRELEASLRQAQKMQAIGQLAGGVAHDFNNMLAAILSATHELAQGGADPALCDLVLAASRRAAELTRNLLSYSRRGKVEHSRVDAHVAVREAVALLARSLDPQVELIVSLDAPGSEVLGDAAQLQSAFLNLGVNARDALHEQGAIRFTSREVELDRRACDESAFELTPGRYLEIVVHDTGAGISPETLPHVFEPFFTTKEGGRGTGLGLAAVYGTVVEHHGAVTVESTVGAGTAFVIRLPLAPGAATAVAPAPVDAPGGQGLVLVVDDEPLVREVGRLLLERLGYTVCTAADGLEAWEVFLARRGELAAVVSDVAMPRVGGRELVRRIRAAAPRFPCVLCSGFPRDGTGDPSVPLLAKPYGVEELATVLAAAIADRAG